MPDRNNYLSYFKRTTWIATFKFPCMLLCPFYWFCLLTVCATKFNIFHNSIHFTILFPLKEKKARKNTHKKIISTSLYYMLINVVQKKGVRNIKETLDILLLSFRITWFYRRKQQTYLALNDLYVVMLCDVGMLPKWYAVCCIEWMNIYTLCGVRLYTEMMHHLKARHIYPFVSIDHLFTINQSLYEGIRFLVFLCYCASSQDSLHSMKFARNTQSV